LDKFSRPLILFLVLAALSALALAAESDSYTVKIAQNKFLGNYLVNQSNFTLYYYQNDSKALEASTCYDECAVQWLPFYTAELTLPEDLRSIDFGEITRTDGTKQTTFKGWPLYLYSKDDEPKETTGEGIEGLWHVIDPTNQPQMI
jgi:predicted lipoprotein with Yx(FWY)xxD motif